MARLRVRVEMNKGRVGIPLEKLAAVVAETEKFFAMLAEDVRLSGPRDWLGLDFENGSLNFNAEYAYDLPERDIITFNSEFDDVRHGKPPARARAATRNQYARIAEPLDPDEFIEFGIYRPQANQPELLPLDKKRAALLVSQQEPVESHASIQGRIHSVFLGADPPHFMLRELATGRLVHCEYEADGVYEQLADALQTKGTVVHVYGMSRIDLTERKIEKIRAQSIAVAETMSDDEFEQFFGCAPNLTGEETTEEFIQRIREREDEPAKDVH